MIGTVYKIEVNKEIYIGSTICKLNKRQREHNYNLKQNYRYKLYDESRKNNMEKIICILLQEQEIENELEIRLLEQQYIDELNPSLNHRSAPSGLSTTEQTKQYREKNKEKIKKHYKEYRENNRDKIREKKQEWRENNRENINEKQKQKITCPICNSVIVKRCLSKHQKTKKCLESKEPMDKV